METNQIGKYIAYQRKQLGITQQELANLIGVTNKAVSKWERGRGLPDISIVQALADALHISVDELLKAHIERKDNVSTHETIMTYTKECYRIYLKYLRHRKRKLMILYYICSSLMLTGGMALYQVSHYIQKVPQFIGIIMIILGIVLLCLPTLMTIIRVKKFQEKNISYRIENQHIIYKDKIETVYDFEHIQEVILFDDCVIMKTLREDLLIDKDDYQDIQITTSFHENQGYALHDSLLTICSIIMTQCICLLIGYYCVLKRFSFEWIYDGMEGLCFVLTILCLLLMYGLYKYQMTKKQILISIGSGMLLCLFVTLYINSQSINKTYYSFSPNLMNQSVLKYDRNNYKLSDYHYKFLFFARKSNQFGETDDDNIETKWMTNDCQVVKYNNGKDIYVSTFGDRGNGISYYYVVNAISGHWKTKNEGDKNITIDTVENGLQIKTPLTQETYSFDEIKQYGTIAMALMKNDIPKYIIVMNENCELTQDYLVKNTGTIQLILVENLSSTELFCTTYKYDQDVQNQIDEKMKERAIQQINEMHDILNNDPTLNQYQSRYDLFSIHTNSTDYFEVVRLAYQKDIGKTISLQGYQETDQITQISVQAGTIKDFYVEVKADTILENLGTGKKEKNGYVPNYRIIKGQNCYLIRKMEYRVPGSEGLNKLEPFVETNVSKDKKYCFVLK